MPRRVIDQKQYDGKVELDDSGRPTGGKRKRSHPLARPDKIANFNGVDVPLYGTEALRYLLGVTWLYLWKREKEGIVPPAMFRVKTRKYYTVWELKVLEDLLYAYGRPRISNKVSPNFIKDWHSQWASLRMDFKRGVFPDVPIWLKYGGREEFRADIAAVLSSQGIYSEVLTDKILHFFILKSFKF